MHYLHKDETDYSDPFNMANQFIDRSKLPIVIRVGNFGIVITLASLVFGGASVKIADVIVPGIRGNGIPDWFWPILIGIWSPGVLGLLLSIYSVARYPYLSLATGGGQRIISSQSWIWTLLGVVFYALAPLIMLTAFGSGNSPAERVVSVYLSIEFLFVGFLLALYQRQKHITIATFLELTFGIGILIFPVFLPSILIGSIRCRRILNNLETIPSK